jgi:predicted nucleic acid-binding protein
LRTRTSVIDSNVLFSIELTDLFLTFAKRRLIRLHWSSTIVDEVRRSLLNSARLSPAAVEHRIAAMQRALPDAQVHIADESPKYLRVASSDRHVLALAVSVRADSIITLNIRDFPSTYCQSFGVGVLSPDDVLTQIMTEDSLGVSVALQEIAERRRLPPMTIDGLLARWSLNLPKFVEVARKLTKG